MYVCLCVLKDRDTAPVDGFTEPQLIRADSDLNQETELWATSWNGPNERGRERERAGVDKDDRDRERKRGREGEM